MYVIIDADYIPYMVAGLYEYGKIPEHDIYSVIDAQFTSIFKNTKATHYISVLSGRKNFRKQQYESYKENRKNLVKPTKYKECREYVIDKYNSYIVHKVEADDFCASLHYQNNNTILCSPDKDLLQCPGLYYNPRSHEIMNITELGIIKKETKENGKKKIISNGCFKIWHQMISGDATDGIKGLKRKGDIYSYNLLKDCSSEEEMFQKVSQEYFIEYGNEYINELTKTYCMVKIRQDLIVPTIDNLAITV
jgi:5'-3' exonuclease